MAGYNGYSMSNNAVAAYGDGEMPISKWTKSTILARIADDCNDEKAHLCELLRLKDLKNYLYFSSWHHSSKFYNQVNFYSLNIDIIEELQIDDIANILNISIEKAQSKLEKLAIERIKAQEKAEADYKLREAKKIAEKNIITLVELESSNIINSERNSLDKCEKLAEIYENYKNVSISIKCIIESIIFYRLMCARGGVRIAPFRNTDDYIYLINENRIAKYEKLTNTVL